MIFLTETIDFDEFKLFSCCFGLEEVFAIGGGNTAMRSFFGD